MHIIYNVCDVLSYHSCAITESAGWQTSEGKFDQGALLSECVHQVFCLHTDHYDHRLGLGSDFISHCLLGPGLRKVLSLFLCML